MISPVCPPTPPVERKTGAVLVIGAGIAGIQASLDLADSGQKVYLVEKSPAIGGNMARLDKTFPTNDCSMCILSPKVVECGRHLNIDVLSWSEVESLAGEPGRFKARIRRRARYVDLEKCTGCGECATACPIEVPGEFDAGLGTRKAIFRPCPQAYPNAFVIDKQGRSPCRVGCPAGININAYVALTAAGRYEEALDVILETVPLPGVLGRVCHHPCEAECHLSRFGEPVSICALKRFLADRRAGAERKPKPPREQKLAKVAIIGSGPGGLTAARDLARMGYRPTIFEAQPRAGGMLAWGIPDYRLPPEVLEREIQDILDEGVELKLGQRFGSDFTHPQLKEQGFAALVLAIGAWAGTKPGIEGEDLEGVADSLAFLRQANGAGRAPVGRQVTVVGGGNAAIDSARTARRLGAEQVTVIYRRSRAEMPAMPAEIEAAEHEGIRFHYLANPVRLMGTDGRLNAVRCVRMELSDPDESGRRRPVPVRGSEFTIETDMLIFAIGQKVVLGRNAGLDAVEMTRAGTLKADPASGATGLPGVFAIGDAVSGPASVVEAMAEGRKAARAVDAYLRGAPFEPLPRVGRADLVEAPPAAEDATAQPPRQRAVEAPPAERARSFAEVEGTLTEEQAVAEAKRCLHCALCSECMACVRACKANAILPDDRDVVEEIEVGAVILAQGFEEFQPYENFEFGYSRYADVLTSIEFERMLSASGPFLGHVVRPSNGRTPRRIAFLQCVGSRDIPCRNGYCSSVCCMYAVKEAFIAREHVRGVEPTVFFMDLRAYGKDFDKYCERAEHEQGVRFVRARVYDVQRSRNGDGELLLSYCNESGENVRESFDLVVLSVGLKPTEETRGLAQRLGLRLNAFGFVWTDPSQPLATSRPGVYVAGVASGPKDIPETVVQASAAACEAGRLLVEASGTRTRERAFPAERDVAAEPPRVGVFVCHCGINIGGVVRVPDVAAYAAALPHVSYAEDNLYTCSQDCQDHVRAVIAERKLNRVVVASCSPRTHEPLFQETLREAGLNPHLFVMANIRDQCSWAHMQAPEAATDKARDLVRMAVAKAVLAAPLQAARVPVIRTGLVVGGGLAGLTAALAIADHGYDVCLVERSRRLGGHLRHLPVGFDDQDLRAALSETVRRVQRHPRIAVRTGATVAEAKGFVGNFTSTLSNGEEFRHGVVLLATGASEYVPREYGGGADPRVLTQRQLLAAMEAGQWPGAARPRRVVMIQCVGSRNEEHPYCSRVCCTRAVKNALRLKALSPETEVHVLYRDIRTYGLRETYYQQARERGVHFVRFDKGSEPQVLAGEALEVRVQDRLLNAELRLAADTVVLSTGIVSNEAENDRLAKLYKVPLNDDGFFLEAHVKLRPVEFATEGVYLAGLAHGPKSVDETIAQALAAASRACTVLQKPEIDTQATIAQVDPDRCVSCGLCESICAYGGIALELQRIGKLDRVFAKVNPALCKGCGACVAGCRSGALNLRGFTDQQILAEIMQL